MARGWYYAKLSLSSALRLSFSGMCIAFCYCSFLFVVFVFVVVFFFCSRWSFGRCSSDLLLSSRPRTGLATTYITGYG